MQIFYYILLPCIENIGIFLQNSVSLEDGEQVESTQMYYQRINITWQIRGWALCLVLPSKLIAVHLASWPSTPAGARHGEHRSLRHWPRVRENAGQRYVYSGEQGANALLPRQPTYHKGFYSCSDRPQVHSFQIHSWGGRRRGGHGNSRAMFNSTDSNVSAVKMIKPPAPHPAGSTRANVKGGHPARCSSQRLNFKQTCPGKGGRK